MSELGLKWTVLDLAEQSAFMFNEYIGALQLLCESFLDNIEHTAASIRKALECVLLATKLDRPALASPNGF